MARGDARGDAGACPCGSCHCGVAVAYAQCCAPFHAGATRPATAEQLMRARYSAYARGDVAYLRDTWHPRFCPPDIPCNAEQRWLGLRVRAVHGGGPGDTHGTVEFVARSKYRGRGYRLHETSRFQRLDGRWVYCDGDIH